MNFSFPSESPSSASSPRPRFARFSATKEMLCLGAGSAFSIIVGIIIDRFEGLGNLENAFIFIASSAFIVSVCNFVCILLMKDEPKKEEKEVESASNLRYNKDKSKAKIARYIPYSKIL